MKSPYRPWIFLFVLGLCGPLIAGHRDTSAQILESVSAVRDPARLEAWLNDARSEAKSGKRVRLVVGQEQHYHFLSAEDAYLVTIHIDAHGVATVLFPAISADENIIAAGSKRDLPRDPIVTEPPLGDDDLFVFSTRTALTRQELGLGGLSGDYPTIDEHEFPAMARKLRDSLNAQPSGSVVAARIRSTVYGRSGAGVRGWQSARPAYTVQDIINYFTSRRTRGLKRPRLDAQIRFDNNHAELTDEARSNLSVFGEALQREELRQDAFVLGGHTDRVGSEAHNTDLSRRRADAVRDYLIREYKIDPGRLATKAYGESDPLRDDDSPESNAMNRRVEFRLGR